MNSLKDDAYVWLLFLRSGTRYYKKYLAKIRYGADKGFFSLANIGTSEQELEKLRIKGCKPRAKEWLHLLECNAMAYSRFSQEEINQTGMSVDDRFDFILGYLRKELESGGLSLADIDMDEEELEAMKATGRRLITQQCQLADAHYPEE